MVMKYGGKWMDNTQLSVHASPCIRKKLNRRNTQMKMLKNEIVFITDNWDKENEYSLKRRNIEANSKKVALEIKKKLELISDTVTMYQSPSEFCQNINQHKDSIVLSTYYGEAAKNSKALIPGMCEANHMLYVGADSYTQMLCNDKYLSKKYISDFGIATPEGILIRNDRDITLIQNLALPLIVKPNFGGGSNGISNNNLVYSYEETQKLIVTLLEYQHLPVLVEEFIPGYEVEFIIFGNKKEIFLFSEIQIEVDGISYFDHQIWGYEAKKAGLHKNKLYPANHTPSEDIPKLHALFQSFDKAEIMRVDCRINDNKLYILELSPDCYLGTTGGVAAAFRQHGIGYSEMFQKLIDNTLQSCIS